MPKLTNTNLLDEIQKSMMEMQGKMQYTYTGLENLEVSGESDGIKITITCTYKFVNIDITPDAMKNGLKGFKRNIAEAWKKACDEVQKTTQNKTMELLQGMNIPEEIRAMSLDSEDEEGGQGGAIGG